MRSSLLLIFLFASVSTLAIVHILALQFFLYFKYPYLDVPMHILGGVVIALALFAAHELAFPVPERYLSFVPVILIVLIVALLWEYFEIQIGIPLIENDFEKDIISDLIFGLFGGILGCFIGTRLRNL